MSLFIVDVFEEKVMAVDNAPPLVSRYSMSCQII